jgi:uncharacterized damage-inducible protein DinB
MSPPRRPRNRSQHSAGPSGSAVQELLFLVDTAYDQTSWHGPNLRGAIRGVTPAQAAWRPTPGRHNIWELVVHAAYWKYVAWRRLTGAKRGSFPESGSNWLVRPAPPRTWKADLALLDETHATLRAAVAALSDRDLAAKAGTVTRRALLTGVAAHDLYHAGQIQLLKRLVGR